MINKMTYPWFVYIKQSMYKNYSQYLEFKRRNSWIKENQQFEYMHEETMNLVMA